MSQDIETILSYMESCVEGDARAKSALVTLASQGSPLASEALYRVGEPLRCSQPAAYLDYLHLASAGGVHCLSLYTLGMLAEEGGRVSEAYALYKRAVDAGERAVTSPPRSSQCGH